MPKLIGIAGRAGAGKDTLADILFERFGVTKIAFADPLKQAAAVAFGLPTKTFHDRNLKEQHNEYWGMTHRKILQLFGNDALKPHFGDDFWVKRWLMTFSSIRSTDSVVVPDVRFENEANLIRGLGGVIVHVIRPGLSVSADAAAHNSEAGIQLHERDVIINNMGTLDQLYAHADRLWRGANDSNTDPWRIGQ